MKYFRWSHDEILNMSWDNYNMYLVSIPSPTESKTDDTDDEASGEVDLFNLHG